MGKQQPVRNVLPDGLQVLGVRPGVADFGRQRPHVWPDPLAELGSDLLAALNHRQP